MPDHQALRCADFPPGRNAFPFLQRHACFGSPWNTTHPFATSSAGASLPQPHLVGDLRHVDLDYLFLASSSARAVGRSLCHHAVA